MLLNFLAALRRAGLPLGMRELLDLLGAMREYVVFADLEEFYFLARTCLIKDECHFDRYDCVFSEFFHGLQNSDTAVEKLLPPEWLQSNFLPEFSAEERDTIEALGGLEKLLEEFRKRAEEQKERHEGGNYWIGVNGSSPFGNSGSNASGIRIGGSGGARRAARVWQQRRYRNLDSECEIGIRNVKLALRRLRRFARSGAVQELDLPGTIRATAHNGGWLDLREVPERRNSVQLLLFLDVGGSMDPHVRICEELFSAARSEFKYLKHFYFHNFIYDSVWRDNHLVYDQDSPLEDIFHKFRRDVRVVFVGDAAMSPYEIDMGGDGDARELSLFRLNDYFDKTVWLNPLRHDHWDSIASVGMVRRLMEGRMYPLTLAGLEQGIAHLSY